MLADNASFSYGVLQSLTFHGHTLCANCLGNVIISHVGQLLFEFEIQIVLLGIRNRFNCWFGNSVLKRVGAEVGFDC